MVSKNKALFEALWRANGGGPITTKFIDDNTIRQYGVSSTMPIGGAVALGDPPHSPEFLTYLLRWRLALRKVGKFALADKVRHWLEDDGYTLQDQDGITCWKYNAVS